MSFFIIPAFWFVGERDNRHAQFSGYVLLDELFKLVEPLVNLLFAAYADETCRTSTRYFSHVIHDTGKRTYIPFAVSIANADIKTEP